MMKKIVPVCLAVILTGFQSYGQPTVEKIIMNGGGRLEVVVPTGFSALPVNGFTSRFPGILPDPIWMITYENGKVMASGTRTGKAVDDNGIPAFTDSIIAALRASANDFKLMDDGILLQDGKNIGFIKFNARSQGQKQFNYMFYVSLEDKLVLFSLECAKKLRKKWEANAEQMAASLRVIPAP